MTMTLQDSLEKGSATLSAVEGARLYPILDVTAIENRGLDPLSVAQTWLENWVRLLQFRHKGPWTRRVHEMAEQVAAMCQSAGTSFVINDRADIAAALGVGVHLGQDDLRPSELGSFGQKPVGWSTHNEAQLIESQNEPATYVALGPIFATGSKANPDPVVGLENLRRWRGLTTRPLVAIGGITRANARGVLDAGADSVAVIGDLLPEDGSVGERIKEWQTLLAR